MAATVFGATIISSTDGDTFAGPLTISSIKAVSAGTGTHFQLKDAAAVVIWESWPGAAGTQEFNQYGDGWTLPAQTYTVKIPAGSGTLYITKE